MRSTLLLLSAALLLVACAAPSTDQERGPLGKADAFGSCETSDCDGPAADGNCFCDASCADFGDCCDDYVPTCEPADAPPCGPAGTACDEGAFCRWEEAQACGAADELGTCASLPGVCPEVFAPVCGCDGSTYSNECHANAAGTSVLHEGACENQGKEERGAWCGGLAGASCGDGQFCRWEESQACGAADQLGTCAPTPDLCPEVFEQVCGCDGVTYSNECHANAAGASVAHAGACS